MRRSNAMADLERRLQFAMVAYVGGSRPEVSPERVLAELERVKEIPHSQMSVHRYRPEDFLVVFSSAEIRNRISASPTLDLGGGVRLFFRPWNRQSQATHALLQNKVYLELEGVPPHAWELDTVESLLGTSCLIDSVAPETTVRQDLASFKVTAWMADPETIPSLRWLMIPEPGIVPPLFSPPVLHYKVLVHLDLVTDYSESDKPIFLGGSSDSGQSGIPEEDEFEGGHAMTRRHAWQFGIRDQRGAQGTGSGGGVGRVLAGAREDQLLPTTGDCRRWRGTGSQLLQDG